MYKRQQPASPVITRQKPTGTQGFQGTQGPGIGDTGPQGERGFQGILGLQGPEGYQGFVGPMGLIGRQGIQGEGVQGPQGFQGSLGGQGYQGLQGKGEKGDSIQGPQGYQGPNGGRGYQGVQGWEGKQGTQGDQGVQGTQGNVGVGFTGPQGAKGKDGDKGDDGKPGLQGFQGLPGSHPCNAKVEGSQVWYSMLDTKSVEMMKGSSGLSYVCLNHGITGKSNQVFEVEIGGSVRWSGKGPAKHRLQINLGATPLIHEEEVFEVNETLEKGLYLRGLMMLPSPQKQQTKMIWNGKHLPLKKSAEDLINTEHLSVVYTLVNAEFEEDLGAEFTLEYVLLRRL